MQRALAVSLLLVGCTGGLSAPDRPGNAPSSESEDSPGSVGGRSNAEGETGDDSETDPSVSDHTLFSCTKPELRGQGRPSIRRLTRDELLDSMEALVGSAIMQQNAVQLAASQIPSETPAEASGDLVREFQNSHSFDHAQGIFNTARAIADALSADPASLTRIFGNCAPTATEACASAFLNAQATRILRRPLDAARKTALLAAFSAEGAGVAGLKVVLTSLLQAPEAVFHLEPARRTCSGGASSAFNWDDASVFFAPSGGAPKVGAQETLTAGGWYVWQVPGTRISDDFSVLTLSVVGGGKDTLVLDVNLNDAPLIKGAQVRSGAGELTTVVSVPKGSNTKIGVSFTNPASGRSLQLRKVTLSNAGICSDAKPANGRVLIDDWAVASRVAYALTGRGPDADLLVAASKNALRNAAQVRPHAERLLKTPAARRQLEMVMDAWLQLSDLPEPTDVIATAAGIDPAGLAKEARQELLDFVTYVAFDRDGDVETLLSEPVGFPRSERMSKLYGSATATGDKPVELPNGHRGLLLRVAPLLSGQRAASPILRGVYVRKRLLCDTLPSPDFSIISAREMALHAADPARSSMRQIVTEITAPNGCMSCHAMINPIGFSLEEFDPLGRPRTVEVAYNDKDQVVAMHPIDTVVDAANIEPGGPDTLDGADALNRALEQSLKVRACLAARFFSTAQLRPLSDADSCAVAAVESALQEGKSLREAWLNAVVNEDLFYRKAGAAP